MTTLEPLQPGAPSPPHRILIAGCFGLGRAGDEAILAAMVEGLLSLPPAVEITVISGDRGTVLPACRDTSRILSHVPWCDPPAIAHAVEASDLIILGGAWFEDCGFDPDSLLTPHHRGLSSFASIAALSTLYRKPFMLYAAGVGPLRSQHSRLFTKAICDRAVSISVRDQDSRDRLRDLGVAESRVRVTAHPAFSLTNGALAPPPAASERYLIGVTLQPGDFGVAQGFWERQVAGALDLLLDAEDGRAVFVPLPCESATAEDDTAALRRVIGQMRHVRRAELSTAHQSIGEIISTLEQCRVVLSMSAESMVFSALAGVPFVALEYDPAASRLADELGMREFSMSLGGMESAGLADLVRKALSRHDEISQHLRIAADGMRSRERENVRLAAALLETAPGMVEPSPDLMELLRRVVEAQMRFSTSVSAERDRLAALDAKQVKELDAVRAKAAADGAAKTEEIKILRTREDALRRRSAQDAERIAYAELRFRRLCRELDLARDQIRSASRPPAALPGTAEYTRNLEARLATLESKSPGAVFKRGLQVLLDLLQIATPELLRRVMRHYYLNYFYYRMYPERRPKLLKPAAAPSVQAACAGYAPFIEFKHQLHRNLPTGFQMVSCRRRAGLVSIVLPVHNGARYVRESVESVLAQSYGDWELIVVDDGSTDQTPAILQAYAADPRVHIIRQAHKKLPAALSQGFAAARGEFYTWTSDDNIMAPDQLTELTGFLSKQPNVEMVYADEYIIDEEGRPAENSSFCPGYQIPPGSAIISRPQDPGELNFVSNNYIGGCFLYRAWAGKIVGDYDERCFGFEDYDYWMRMNALFRISHLGVRKPLYRYRLHSTSLTARDRQLRITERMRAFVAVEESRRSFFAESFDITLAGRHPWFQELGKYYQEYGNNVFFIEGLTETTRYHYEVTRAFAKSAIVFSGAAPAAEFERLLEWSQVEDGVVLILLTDSVSPPALPDSILDRFDWIVVTEDGQPGERHDPKTLWASSVASLAYPLLAAVNARCYARQNELRGIRESDLAEEPPLQGFAAGAGGGA